VRGHLYPIELHELTERLPLSREEVDAWRRHSHLRRDGRLSETPPPSRRWRRPIGRLRLVLPNAYRGGRTIWSDGPRGPLENKLASALRTLELRADADDRSAAERERRFAELQGEQEARDERARREFVETTCLERLLAEVASWRRSDEIRAYVAALEERVPAVDPDERVRIARWCQWARERADAADQTRRTSLILGLDDA
jgi:hypothetical protein